MKTMSIPFRLVLSAAQCQHLLRLLGAYPSATFLRLPPASEQLSLLRDQAEVILDDLGDLLCAQGITGGEINAFGLQLEPLIDLINQPLHD
jgi:hypothetical protein